MRNKLKILFSLLLALIIILGFTVPVNLSGGWYQQYMPNLNGRQIQDIFFLDSLTGYAVTNSNGQYDTAYILKTTNSGENWIINYRRTAWFTGFNKIRFINSNTGFVCGVSVSGGPKGLTKTTDGGVSWNDLNIPDPYLPYKDMSVINQDILWLVNDDAFSGGVFYTSNGGINWEPQFSGGNQNPNKIYMYNARIGFISNSSASPNIYKTTNGGDNWNILGVGENFFDMFFIDSLTGWKCNGYMKKTIDGGLNWINQILPSGGMIITSEVLKFSVINQDTIWAGRGWVQYPNFQSRAILYRTTNGGLNWLFQVPDTSIQIFEYYHIKFIAKLNGWAYGTNRGSHTVSGGNDTFYTGLQQTSNNIPIDHNLYQNFPNPFNPKTTIKYQITDSKEKITNVKLIIYDIQGREILKLVDENQQTGIYEVDFPGFGLSSGIYFYTLIINNKLIDTKKMILIK